MTKRWTQGFDLIRFIASQYIATAKGSVISDGTR
jgi:hypothetical protein